MKFEYGFRLCGRLWSEQRWVPCLFSECEVYNCGGMAGASGVLAWGCACMYVCPGLRLKYTGLRIVMYLFGSLPDARKHYSTSRNYCLCSVVWTCIFLSCLLLVVIILGTVCKNLAVCKHGGGRPGIIYQVNGISVYLGRQRGGRVTDQMDAFRARVLRFEPRAARFTLCKHSKLQCLGQKLQDQASSSFFDTRPSHSVFAYCKRSKTGQWEGLGTRLLPPYIHLASIWYHSHEKFSQAFLVSWDEISRTKKDQKVIKGTTHSPLIGHLS